VLIENSTPEQLTELINQLLLSGGEPHPSDGNGHPIPPPLKLPPGPNGEDNPWKKVKGTPSRPIK
jgi:hypothetical protein